MSAKQGEPAEPLETVTLTLCRECLTGAGGECHMPGCALWMGTAPDVSLIGRVVRAPAPVPVEEASQLARVLERVNEIACGDESTEQSGELVDLLQEFKPYGGWIPVEETRDGPWEHREPARALAAWLVSYRHDHGLTQAELADRLGWPTSLLEEVENAEGLPAASPPPVGDGRVVADPDCICRGSGIVTRLALDGPGTTGPELCSCLRAPAPSPVQGGGERVVAIIDRLRANYTPEGVGVWLCGAKRSLNGERVIDLLREGRLDEVEAIVPDDGMVAT